MKYFLGLVSACVLLFSTACLQSPERLLASANKYHDNKKYKEASILYQKVIAKDKTNAEAYYREGINLLDAGSPVDAARFLRRAVDLKPDNTDAEVKLADIYLRAYAEDPKKFQAVLPEVRDLAAKIQQKDPSSADALRLQGVLFLIDKDTDKALETFAKANQIKPYSRNLVDWYAQTLFGAKRNDEAVALVRDMLAHDKTWQRGYDFLVLEYSRENDKAKVEQVLREHVQNEPASAVAIQNLSNFLAATGRYPEAETTIKRVLDDPKNFPAGHLMVGDFYMRAKKFDEALNQYREGANSDSKNAVGYQERIVQAYNLTGRTDQALALSKELANKHPKDGGINAIYGALLLETTKPANLSNALEELKKITANNPDNGLLRLHLSRAYLASNDREKALSEALEATRLQPSLLAARTVAARIYEDQGQHAKALEQTDAVLRANANDPEARLIRDRALIGTDQADKAFPELETLVQQYPHLNDAHLQLATLYMGRKEYAKAAAEYQAVANSNPPDERGIVGLQTVNLAQGKADQAVQAMQQIMQKNPTPSARANLANFQATAGAMTAKSNPERARQYFQDAAENYKQVVKQDPKQVDAWLRLGILQRQLGDNDGAMSSFKQAESVSPNNVTALLNQATLLDSMGRKTEATQAYNRVLGVDSENTLALNNLAFLTAESGSNLDQAMTFAERAKKRLPDNPDVSDTLGYVYYQKNLTDEAIRIFKQLVQEQPQNSTFRLHLAMALLKQGDRQGAREEAQRAMKTANPDQMSKIRSFVSQIG